ncbi:MAG: hypothetical protein M3X11_04275 [Acidobacteriota bacterium]|nr:hypothetical protein [Acidobacteriota bacterium]
MIIRVRISNISQLFPKLNHLQRLASGIDDFDHLASKIVREGLFFK